MKKLFALLLCLTLLMTSVAQARWIVPAEDVDRGGYETLNFDDHLKLRVFTYNGFKAADPEQYNDSKAAAMWITEEGVKLTVECSTLEAAGVSSLDDIDAIYQQLGYRHEIANQNGTDVLFFCTDDNLVQRGLAMIISDVGFQVKVKDLPDESWITLADNMLHSIYTIAVNPGDIGVKSEDLDMENGQLFPININSTSMTMYLPNDYHVVPHTDEMDKLSIISRLEKESGEYINFYAYKYDYLKAYTLYDFFTVLEDSGFDSRLVTINGMDVAYFASKDGSEHGIMLPADGRAFMIKAAPVYDEDQLAAVRKMLFSTCPVQK